METRQSSGPAFLNGNNYEVAVSAHGKSFQGEESTEMGSYPRAETNISLDLLFKNKENGIFSPPISISRDRYFHFTNFSSATIDPVSYFLYGVVPREHVLNQARLVDFMVEKVSEGAMLAWHGNEAAIFNRKLRDDHYGITSISIEEAAKYAARNSLYRGSTSWFRDRIPSDMLKRQEFMYKLRSQLEDDLIVVPADGQARLMAV